MKKLLSILSIILITQSAIAIPVPEANTTNYNVKIHDINRVPIIQTKQEPPQIEKSVNTQLVEQTNKNNFDSNLVQMEDLREQAKFLYNTNNIKEALALFNQIKETDKISEDWLFMANISSDIGQTDDAVFYLKKAIALDDRNYKAHYNLGNIYFDEKQYNAAIKEYNKVLKIKKDFAYAHFNKGCCFLAKNSLINARYEFGLAIKSNPNEPSFYYNLAYTNKLLNKPKKAQEALDIYNKFITE